MSVTPNVRVNPARGGGCCKAGLRRWYTLDAARPYSARRSGSGLNEGLGITAKRQCVERRVETGRSDEGASDPRRLFRLGRSALRRFE